jgi:hypothetical protein
MKPNILVTSPATSSIRVPFMNFDILLPAFSKMLISDTIIYMQGNGQSMTGIKIFKYIESQGGGMHGLRA